MVFMHGLEFADNRFGEASAASARCLTADLPGNADFSALERAALRLSEELVRRHLESAMQAAADAQAREMSVDGARRSPPSRSTLERLALRLGTKVRETA